MNAEAGALFNVTDRSVVYSKNAFERLHPASTTKVMDCHHIALEEGNPLGSGDGDGGCGYNRGRRFPLRNQTGRRDYNAGSSLRPYDAVRVMMRRTPLPYICMVALTRLQTE